MGFSSGQILLLFISLFILTTQGHLTLDVSPVIRAECGQQVNLTCNVSSSRPGFSIKNLRWVKNHHMLCVVNSEGNITEHQHHTLSDFHCEYEGGQLSLVFQRVQPVESGASVDYMCKLHSNQGVTTNHTKVELQDCCGNVQDSTNPEGPSCTFTEVHPDADVHWFLSSHNFTGETLRGSTDKRWEEGGWLTIHSYLEEKDSDELYNCSLWCPTSNQYITSRLIPQQRMSKSGATAQRPFWTFFFSVCFSTLLAAIMK